MADTKYIYRGPMTGVSLSSGEAKKRQTRRVLLHDGGLVELPADHPYVARLVRMGRLVPPKEPEPTQETTPAAGTTPAAESAASTQPAAPEKPKNRSSSTVTSDTAVGPKVTGKEPV
jgi:hypothetical protein